MSIRTILFLVSTAALAALAVPAGAAGGTFVHYGELDAAPSVYGAATAQDFLVPLQAGDTVTASLEWFDGATDLDLELMAPAGSCVLTPSPDTGCLVNSVPGRVTCSDRPTPGLLLDGSTFESWSYTVPAGGLWKVSVRAAASLVPGPVTYVLLVDVDGAGDTRSITYDRQTTYVGGSQCRFL